MNLHASFVRLVCLIALFACTIFQVYAQSSQGNDSSATTPHRLRSITNAQRNAVAAKHPRLSIQQAGQRTASPLLLNPNGVPDYFNVANYANSPLPTVDPNTGAITGGIRKFVDYLPGLGAANANNLGQYIPIANPDTITYPGSDYYEIALVEYSEKMHSDLPPTKLRGYVQTNAGTDPLTQKNTIAPAPVHYLGPIIVAQRNRPVRVKFTNKLPIGAGGDLFIPVDTTMMGAGTGPLAMETGNMELYKQNRAVIHLHGGATGWISDGTPHQWITPAGETTSYPQGVSKQNVPDMPDPGPGAATFYYTNQQSSRLMFYHDHAYGITRLNVYAGEAAGYVLTDAVEEDLISKQKVLPDLGGANHYGIPLIIQDKTFVPALDQLAATDPTWDPVKWGGFGQLWYPHVYVPNQNPNDDSGVNPFGRWDYGPWFWPPVTSLNHPPTTLPDGTQVPSFPNPTSTMEAFMDTPVINGTVYPVLPVERKAYRFRILNACNDRWINLQLYYADPANPTEVKMVPAVPHAPTDPTWPASWPTDGRDGGVPDPTMAGPSMIQIGTEGGFLPTPVVLPNTPIGYNYNRRDIVVLNVSNHTLLLGPAERADVIVDFSGVPDGARLILYNDGPAPNPAFDTRYDYYTGDPDQTSTGGAPTTLPGYGPNTRTIMQFQVASGGTVANQFDLTALNNALPAAYAASQPAPIVPEQAYGAATNTYSRIQDTSLTFTPAGSATPVTVQMEPKAIQELFELDYGRMNATLGVELPFTNFNTQTTIPYGYIDPVTEKINDGQVQIWKITHNGVDTHAIHFHLFNVQVINRVGWDGAIRPPEPNELGWKDTVRMNPLEDCIVALLPVQPAHPFGLPESIRPLDPTMPVGSMMGFSNVGPDGNPVTTMNEMTNFGWEYVWHCHMLDHEEMDMMRPISFTVQVMAPATSNLTVTAAGKQAVLTWTDPTPAATSLGNSGNEIGYRIERAPYSGGVTGVFTPVGTALANVTTFTDAVQPLSSYAYRVIAYNAAGETSSNIFALNVPAAFLVTPSSPVNGAISPNTPQWVSNGGSITFTATPNAGFGMYRWLVDGSVAQVGGTSFTLTSVIAPHTVGVTFARMPVITISTPVNGSVSPNTTQMVAYGSSLTFTAAPNTGYAVYRWLVDGNVAQTGGTTFTLTNITLNHTVGVQFILTPVITINTPVNGAVSPNTPQTVAYGSFLRFTATPNAGYTIYRWLVDGVVKQTGGTTFTLTNITANHTVSAQFIFTPTVTTNVPLNGTISPNTPQVVVYGSSLTFNATPSGGYTVNTWLVDGVVVQTGGTSFTLTNIRANHTVAVTFKH